jgi:multidrug resistance efflux pump
MTEAPATPAARIGTENPEADEPSAPPSPAPESRASGTAPPAPAAPNRGLMWKIILGLIAVAGVLLVLHAWRLPPFSNAVQRTEDAYVRGQVTIVSPQVSGYVTRVLVQDYQRVKAGQLLATIDDRIYRQRLEQARAALHSAEAALANSTQTQQSARGSVAQTSASVQGAEAQLAKARADYQRIEQLAPRGWVTRSQVDAARAATRSAEAALAQTRAQVGIAQTSVTSAVVGREGLVAAVENAQAQVRLAQIDLDNTRIVAPADGKLGEVSVRQGQQVATGTQLMALVPERLWVVANLKETQMKNVRAGERATLSVDFLGGEELTGKVSEIAPATGSEFSVIRTDNASGNFTKVPQRVTVKILLDPGQPMLDRLRPGLSVVAKIDTRS